MFVIDAVIETFHVDDISLQLNIESEIQLSVSATLSRVLIASRLKQLKHMGFVYLSVACSIHFLSEREKEKKSWARWVEFYFCDLTKSV